MRIDLKPHDSLCWIVVESRIKGKVSNGHGFGAALIDAVARAHGWTICTYNRSKAACRLR